MASKIATSMLEKFVSITYQSKHFCGVILNVYLVHDEPEYTVQILANAKEEGSLEMINSVCEEAGTIVNLSIASIKRVKI